MGYGSGMDASTIKAARLRRGDSMEAAADAVGVTARTWWGWEKDGCQSRSPAIIRSLEKYVKGKGKAR